jgi:hypothetical protein
MENQNKFLLDFALYVIPPELVKGSKWDYAHFGSWWIELLSKQIVFDGRDEWLYLNIKEGNDWKYQRHLKRDELDYRRVIELIQEAMK